jgi:hypothetical protein
MSSETPLRLPDDVDRLVDPALARRPDDLAVACYTFPHYHRSAFNDRILARGWTEYELMRGCRPWFPGHHQPRTPLLGELDEADPATWVTYVDLAVASGIDVFIFDWYWYNHEPALHEALEQGFLRAPGRERMRFATLWTNHEWAYWFPTAGLFAKDEWLQAWEKSGLGSYEPSYGAPESEVDVWRSLSYMIARYFHDPCYWRIDDEPVLPIWNVSLLVDRFGVEGTRTLLAEVRAFARKLGHKGLHIHAVTQELGMAEAIQHLPTVGVNSYGMYNSIAATLGGRPIEEETPDFGECAADVISKVWPRADALLPLPCFPCISPGADDSPRHLEPKRPAQPDRRVWPAHPIVVNETPAAFEALARAALAYLNGRPEIPPIITIGCWNEWTEGHYLLPDTRLGYGMARALGRAVRAEATGEAAGDVAGGNA